MSDVAIFTSANAQDVWYANILAALQQPMNYLRSGRIPPVLGLFLLGVWLARYFLARLQAGYVLPKSLWLVNAAIGLACSFAYASIKAITGTAFSADAAGWLQGLVYHLGCTTLMLGYAGALIWIWQTSMAQKLPAQLAFPGRMPLTNYISQNLIAVLLFYGNGFAWVGEFPFAFILLVAFAILLA